MNTVRTMRSATHIAFDPFTPDTLLRLGSTTVVQALDRLVIGPCRPDPAEHARVRLSWWHSTEGWDQLYSPDIRWEPPVVVWVSASIVERVNLWRVCDWLRRIGLAHQDVFVLDFERIRPRGTPKEPLPPFDCTSSVSDHPDEILLERLAAAEPWPSARYDRAVSLWDEYVDPDPSRFIQSCVQGVEGFSELGPLWRFLSSLFPIKTDEGTLRLSRLDELLFTILSDQWLTPVAVLAHKSEAGVELRQWLSCTGDLFLEDRLAQWARHGSGAVARAAGQRPDREMVSSVYGLTDVGKRFRDSGLPQLSDAPALPIGGIEAYAPSSPWVLAKGGLVRL
ncbi:MAG: hypothetical protein IPK82_11130 [Polyangiaceae bacterium]|nr:hypothetical protein [Polyangiaceae bacterium]